MKGSVDRNQKAESWVDGLFDRMEKERKMVGRVVDLLFFVFSLFIYFIILLFSFHSPLYHSLI